MRDALVWTVSRWARTRDPRLADLADCLTTPRAPIAASKKAVDLDAWRTREALHDVDDFPGLVAAARGGSQDDVVRQVQALAAWNDPRFGAGLLGILEKPPYAGIKSRGMLSAIFAALLETRDVRLAAPCRELASRYLKIVSSSTGGWIVTELTTIAARLDAVTPEPPSAEDEARLAELERSFVAVLSERRHARRQGQGHRASLEALFADVYASPDDDGPRLVLADALLEQGNERGEMIQLQIARANGIQTEVQAAREQALLDAHAADWAQPLANAGRCTFERGFPVAIALYRTAKKAIGEPALATIRRIEAISNVSQKDALALLDHAHGVREVATLTAKLAAIVTAKPRPWTHVAIDAEKLSPGVVAALPELRSLKLRVPNLNEGLADAKHLEHLELDGTTLVGPLPPTLRSLAIRMPHLPADALAGLDRLLQLRLDVTTLPEHALAGLDALVSLDLSTKRIEAGSLAGATGLRTLRLECTNQERDWPNDLFTPVPGLRTLDVTLSRLITSSHLATLPALEELHARYLRLDELLVLPRLTRLYARPPRQRARLDLRHLPALEILELDVDDGVLAIENNGTSSHAEAWHELATSIEASTIRELVIENTVKATRDEHGRFSMFSIMPKANEPIETWRYIVRRAFGDVAESL